MGFIGYRHQSQPSGDAVRIYLECQEEPAGQGALSCSYAVDVIFPGGAGTSGESESPCLLRGVDDILSLKKFYKLVFSLEERAREHGNPFHAVFESPGRLLEHLAYTRNVRQLREEPEPALRGRKAARMADMECSKDFWHIT